MNTLSAHARFCSATAHRPITFARTLEASDPFNILYSLGWWALVAFCSHVMLARTLHAPFGVVVEFALIPLFVLGFYFWDRRKPTSSDAELSWVCCCSCCPVTRDQRDANSGTCR